MKKVLKKITATAMAAILAMGTMGVMSFAGPVSEDTWEVLYYNHPGTGSYTGTKDSCYMSYSSYGNKASCLKMEVTVSGATGYVNVRTDGSNVTSASGKLTYAGDTLTLKPQAQGEVYGVYYEFSGYTSVVGNTIKSSGTMETIKRQ